MFFVTTTVMPNSRQNNGKEKQIQGGEAVVMQSLANIVECCSQPKSMEKEENQNTVHAHVLVKQMVKRVQVKIIGIGKVE